MYRLLIVDDEPLVQIGLKSMLAKELADKIEVVGTASNGQEAWDIISENPPDIVIADIRMPVMDGVELMKQTVALPKKPAIIVLSGFDDFSYAKAAIESGASSYILKPVEAQELLKAVEKALAGVKRDIQLRVVLAEKTEELTQLPVTEPDGFPVGIDVVFELRIRDAPSGVYGQYSHQSGIGNIPRNEMLSHIFYAGGESSFYHF